MCVVKKSDTYLRRRADGGAQLEVSSTVGFIDFVDTWKRAATYRNSVQHSFSDGSSRGKLKLALMNATPLMRVTRDSAI